MVSDGESIRVTQDKATGFSGAASRAGMTVLSRSVALAPAAVLTVGLAAGLAGCKQKSGGQPSMPPQPVTVVTVHPHPVHMETVLPGRLDAFEQASIRPQVGGVILTRNFEQGTDVDVGQLLYKINPAPYQATYDQAKAQLQNAEAAAVTIEAQLKRYKPLAKAHAVSQQEYDNTLAQAKQAEAQIAQAKANVASAKVNLDWTDVRSPIKGRIGRMLITPGTLVTSGQTTSIALVTRLDPIYADVNLADSDMLRLRREMASGQLKRDSNGKPAVKLMLDDGSTYEQTGELKLAEVTVNPATGTLTLRAQFPNPDRLLMPGMFVHTSIDEGVDPDAFTVPQVALQRNTKGDPQVYVVGADDKVAVRPVKTVRTVGSDWLISDGLKDGDRVMTSGFLKAKPGQKVSPKEVPVSGDDTKKQAG